jgi:multidrug efflux pump subunit AcrB
VGYADEVLSRIATVEGIETAGASMSSGGLLGGLGGGSGSYDVTVYITLADENGKGSEVGKQIVQLCEDLPCEVSASSAMMDMSMLSGSGLTMQIYAQDMDTLQSAARKAAQVLETVPGTTEVSDGLEDAAPALHIAIDRNKAMSKGLTVAQVYMELAEQLTTSTTAATLELSGTSTDVIVEKPEDLKLTRDKLNMYQFEVTNQDGTTSKVYLRYFATIEETTSLSSISRLEQRRYLSVSAAVEEGYNVTLVTDEAQKLMADADLGEGVTYRFSGENETIMEAVEQLGLMLLLGILLVYLVMVAQFQSLKSPFIVMFTIPLAFTGGFIALLLCGMEVSVVSLIGFVMLVGIIVNNGIVLVDYINQLRLEGMERREAILEAGKTRMRPILMTSITTILGLIDMATNDAAGTAIMQPVAVVCIGGLIYATLMTLFVVPVIYDMFNKKELRNIREEDLKMLDI